MASSIEIANLALSHIGAPAISSFDENTKEALTCKRFYDNARKAALRDHKWNFATKEVELALLIEEYLGFDYAYAYPIDCLLVHRIYNANSKYKKLEYSVRLSNDNSNRVILTDQEDVNIIYTTDVENTNVFDSLFIDVFAWRLAVDLAQPISGDMKLQQLCSNSYLLLIAKAQAIDANENYEEPTNENVFVEARG